MIDFSKLKTPEQKLIALFVSISLPMRQKEIFTTLNISEYRCREALKHLENLHFIEKFQNEYGVYLYRLTAPEVRSTAPEVRSTAPEVRSTAPEVRSSAPESPSVLCHVCKDDSPLMKVKQERKRKFNSKIESEPQSEPAFKSTWNILAHIPDELMPKFAETVNFVWKYLKCRRSEKFSPDLIWRIAYPFVSDEFGEVTNDWLDRLLKECETAKNAEGIDKCTVRCAVITKRVQILYEYHNWLYASCRKEYDCCEEERHLAKTENRAFRLELFPMEAERLKAEAARLAAEAKKAEEKKQYEIVEAERAARRAAEAEKKPAKTPSESPSSAAVLPAGVPAAEPGHKYANKPHYSRLLTQKSLDAVKRNASKINSNSGVSTVGEAVRELADDTRQPEPVPPQPKTKSNDGAL